MQLEALAIPVRASSAPRKLRGHSSWRLLNRELSWIEFDRRVLELAADPSVPLLDRVRYCAIASANLDEFFAVRMAELDDHVFAGVSRRAPDGRRPAQTLAAAREAIVALQATQDALWNEDLRPALAARRMKVGLPAESSESGRRALRKRWERDVLPLLTPIGLGPAAPFPHMRSSALGIGACVGGAPRERFVFVGVPRNVPRFLELGTGGIYVPVEDVILQHLPELVGADVRSQCVFRVTRNADVSIATDADDLLEAMEVELDRRLFGRVVRLEVDVDAPEPICEVLMRELDVRPEQVYRSAAPLGLAELEELSAVRRPDLRSKRWRPVTSRAFGGGGGTALLARIRRRSLLAHHPYDAYDTSVERFVSASRSTKIAALKATVYRTGKPSGTVKSLVDAADAGKEATCLVELRARFDERRNIEWSRALDRAGVQVVYGDPDFKVHAKLCLLVRRESGRLRRYAHIGTGNYHASNASAYEDLSLFTADEDITADVADVFNAVTSHTSPDVFRKLLVAPWFLRDGLLYEIDRVARAAAAGEAARIRIKVNSLADAEIAEALYAASAAGARVEAITRGICILRPGVTEMSEQIAVRSVLGPFLEHSRIFSFEAGDDVSMWVGSADLMPRNLDRRIEVLAPVEDARLQTRLTTVFDALVADTRFAWELQPDGSWERAAAAPGTDPVSAQDVLMQQARGRAKKRT